MMLPVVYFVALYYADVRVIDGGTFIIAFSKKELKQRKNSNYRREAPYSISAVAGWSQQIKASLRGASPPNQWHDWLNSISIRLQQLCWDLEWSPRNAGLCHWLRHRTANWPGNPQSNRSLSPIIQIQYWIELPTNSHKLIGVCCRHRRQRRRRCSCVDILRGCQMSELGTDYIYYYFASLHH